MYEIIKKFLIDSGNRYWCRKHNKISVIKQDYWKILPLVFLVKQQNNKTIETESYTRHLYNIIINTEFTYCYWISYLYNFLIITDMGT